jgi:hypothetical protein
MSAGDQSSIRTQPIIISLVVGAGLLIAACGSSGATPASTPGASKGASLQQAVANTLSSPNFSEVVNQTSPQGKQTDYLVYQAPDRLGGYIQRGSSRTYVYVIGTTQYQSQAVPSGTSTKQLIFHSQASQGAAALDPAHGYLPYATQTKHPTRSGDTYSFTLTNQGKTGTFTYAVSGQHISRFTLGVPPSSVQLDISAIGTSPPVALPTGAKKEPASPASTAPPSS